MKYGTTTELKYKYPYVKGWCKGQKISEVAKKRLIWMDYLKEGNSVLKASRHFDIPESTIRHWKNRYLEGDLRSLEDKSKRPKKPRSSKVTYEDRMLVVEIRVLNPYWGKITIQEILRRDYGVKIGQSRIQKIINQNNLKRLYGRKVKHVKRNRKHMYTVPPRVKKQVGGLVYMDVKHLNVCGVRMYQFVALDHCSRYLSSQIYMRIKSTTTNEFLDTLPYKKIKYIGTDNGSEFLGAFDQELKKRKIKHVFSSPRSPKQNPYVERVIRTIIDEEYLPFGLRGTNIREQQEQLNEYVQKYNYIRPHRSLNLKCPYEIFNMSPIRNMYPTHTICFTNNLSRSIIH